MSKITIDGAAAAVDDDVTPAAAGRAAFAGWPAGRRAAPKVEWHWS